MILEKIEKNIKFFTEPNIKSRDEQNKWKKKKKNQKILVHPTDHHTDASFEFEPIQTIRIFFWTRTEHHLPRI